MDSQLIITINPGSTSTKIAVFEEDKPIFEKNIKHSTSELESFHRITDQFDFRKDIITKELKKAGINFENVVAIVGRGGLVRPIESGVYAVNRSMIDDLKESARGEHASNLGGLIAYALLKECPGSKAYIANPVVVDELDEIARISGHPLFPRKSVFHALNQKATARRHAKAIGKKYEDINLIVAHLGGGISVGAHRRGRVIDVNQAIGGEGPFSPERAGTLPVIDVVKACFSGKYTEEEMTKMLIGKGGLAAYLDTNNAMEVEDRVKKGDKKATLIYEAMAYQVAKIIGEMYTVLKGDVDNILITGGIAYDKWFVEKIRERVHKLAPCAIYPGENEMEALAMNGLRAINDPSIVKEY
ncbi:MAG: butyrate kinase [Bacteroidetes bacterium]|nr:butyrate kinase [Bacteroidota bacterium]